MQVYQIEMESRQVKNQMVSVTLLQALLSVLIEGSKGALRLQTEGRSTVRGAPPQWIKAATTFSMAFKENKLHVESPTLFDAAPEIFKQNDWFADLNPQSTSLDYFQDSLAGVLNPELVDSLYDKALLEAFQGFRHVFSQGVDKVHFLNKKGLHITPETITMFKEREASLPFPCPVKVLGHLEAVRAQDRTFKLVTVQDEHVIKGIAKHIAHKKLQTLLNKEVLISGIAYFTMAGKTLRVEAEQIAIAGERELALWSKLPVSILSKSNANQYKMSHGSQTDDQTIFDQWPEGETEEELAKWRTRLS